MWVWNFECYGDPVERDALIRFSKEQGITRLLMQIHHESDGSSIRAPDALGELVQKAGEAGIAVEALEGEPGWALASGQGDFWPKIDAIVAWNEKQPSNRRLSGIHLDIEPYLLKQFTSAEKPQLMREYLEMLEKVAKRVKVENPPMTLAADIPFWYDSREEKDPENNSFEFNGKKQYLNRHVQDICDYVAVMSYRRKAVGANSITACSEGEVAYAETIGKRAFAGVETTELKESPTISFFGTDPSKFKAEVGLVFTTFGDRKGFGGVMIHHYKSYRAYAGSAAAVSKESK